MKRLLRYCPLLFTLLASTAHAQWTVPTEEELKMTSQPEVPGAAAVYLFREEFTEDKNHMWSIYVRLKILTERGKEKANVELTQYHATDHGGYTVNEIEGRTIHPDGTIIPFTGKPFEKLVEKSKGVKVMSKVFTLPDVEVGSIIEYRYKLRYDDNYFISPEWFIQSEFFTRKAHYLWKPTDHQLVTSDKSGGQLTTGILWTPILPKGAEVKQIQAPGSGGGQLTLELNVHDIPPAPDEEYMPPIASLSYRVLFYYSPYRSGEEFWKNEGKRWSKEQDKFIGPGAKVREAVAGLVAPSDTPDQKLRKFYAAVMKLDNTAYSRSRSTAEEKSQGLNEAKSTDDIWERKRGTDDQIALLFIAMARAAGLKAYAMGVTDRDRALFVPSYLSLNQLNDLIAIVVVDGKDQFFDPGQRDCPFGHLAWKHTIAQGIRQTESGFAAISAAPDEPYTWSRTQRVANLTLDEHGEATGTVKMTWMGAPALTWRQRALRGDQTSLERDLRVALEHLMPANMDVKLGAIQNLEDYELPLVVNYNVKGALASFTGKRLILPGDLFEENAKPTFPHANRETPVYFEYPHMVEDAVRINFPASFTIESSPIPDKIPMQKVAIYSLVSEPAPNSITVRRSFLLGGIFYPLTDYAELREFYRKVEARDQQSTVLRTGTTAPAGN